MMQFHQRLNDLKLTPDTYELCNKTLTVIKILNMYKSQKELESEIHQSFNIIAVSVSMVIKTKYPPLKGTFYKFNQTMLLCLSSIFKS